MAAARVLLAGGIVAYPTEGVWGLGCDPANPNAVGRLLTLKRRDRDKGLVLLAANFKHLELWIAPLDPAARARLEATWPGPVTWIVPAAADCPAWITGARSTVAVRVSAHPVAHDLAAAAGTAIVSTSANSSGEPPVPTAEAVLKRFGAALAGLVDGRLGGLAGPTEIRELASGRVVRPAPGWKPGCEHCKQISPPVWREPHLREDR